ncbi:hypothetical protein A264_20903 [Pseudomonas syringae pv. actinidiae ICMP 19071]|nr:hypothetical protein A264_20903 [Pseudomonas syringae pv. actinidiae ICMP 19071]RMS02963.1 hypothetical protein ALP75_201307 [Pseudomonas syringae pv. actinidiae]
MQSIMRKTLQQGLFILWGSALFGCSSASNEMAGGNLQAVNHTVHGINWMSVNGYRADGGGWCVMLHHHADYMASWLEGPD